MSTRRRPSAVAAVAAASALAVLAAPGCRTVFEGGTERFTVKPGVAFSMLRDAPYLPILDLRPAAEFHGPLGHMAGARSIPLDELEAHRAELDAYREVTVLVYCRATECGRDAYQRLSEFGLDDPVFIDGGLEAWSAAGYGTVHRGEAEDHRDERAGYEP
jgi:rhodanese-related sulfurtransferase